MPGTGAMWEGATGQGEGVGTAALPSGCEPWACQHQERGGVQWTGVLSDPAPGCPALSLDHPDSGQQPDSNSQISKTSLGDGPVFTVLQKPDTLNQINELFPYMYV